MGFESMFVCTRHRNLADLLSSGTKLALMLSLCLFICLFVCVLDNSKVVDGLRLGIRYSR